MGGPENNVRSRSIMHIFQLIFKLATARLTQEALAEIEAVKTLNPEFNVSPSTCDIILDNFIR